MFAPFAEIVLSVAPAAGQAVLAIRTNAIQIAIGEELKHVFRAPWIKGDELQEGRLYCGQLVKTAREPGELCLKQSQ